MSAVSVEILNFCEFTPKTGKKIERKAKKKKKYIYIKLMLILGGQIRVRQHSFMEIDHNIFSVVAPIQEG